MLIFFELFSLKTKITFFYLMIKAIYCLLLKINLKIVVLRYFKQTEINELANALFHLK